MKIHTLVFKSLIRLILVASLIFSVSACFDGDSDDSPFTDEQPDPNTQPDPDPEMPTANLAKSDKDLQWKRYQSFEQDLSNALSLPKSEICSGPEGESCIRDLFLIPLGGHDPFEAATYESAKSPLNTTAGAVDRVVLSACSKRIEMDSQDSDNALFKQLDFSADISAQAAENIEQYVQSLFQRFHQRDPSATEVEVLNRLNSSDAALNLSTKDFAKMACYAVGSTSEFLFF